MSMSAVSAMSAVNGVDAIGAFKGGMVEVNGLHAGYDAMEVVRGVGFFAKAGEVVSLVGRNGVGKTTTLRALMGLAKVFKGEVVMNHLAAGNTPKVEQACRNGVGYIAQYHDVCQGLTVEDNLLLPLYANGLPTASVERAYARFSRLSERRKQVAGSLSGGERKLLAFARIMLLNPTVYLIDEPTEGLMPRAVDEITSLIKELAAAGACVVLIEQNLEMVRELSKRIYFMNNGRTEAVATALDDALVSRFLGV
jgi:branched-chain amino acid transport system ATP-binding protein